MLACKMAPRAAMHSPSPRLRHIRNPAFLVSRECTFLCVLMPLAAGINLNPQALNYCIVSIMSMFVHLYCLWLRDQPQRPALHVRTGSRVPPHASLHHTRQVNSFDHSCTSVRTQHSTLLIPRHWAEHKTHLMQIHALPFRGTYPATNPPAVLLFS